MMSIFTYHLIEALTGHAAPADGATEVLVSDVMSHVWRRVPASARAEAGAEQEPDYRVSGNFAVALLLGGRGLGKGIAAPDPLLTPAEPPPASSVTQTMGGSGVQVGRDQTVQDDLVVGNKIGRQINTGGGAYVGGNVTTVGGKFVGRDEIVTQASASRDELLKLLADLRQQIAALQAQELTGEDRRTPWPRSTR